jgi:hypothetical protein
MRASIDDDRCAKPFIVVLLTRSSLIGMTRVTAYTLTARSFPDTHTRSLGRIVPSQLAIRLITVATLAELWLV